MIYKNPVIKGFFPDPSVCFSEKHGKYFLVSSTFQYFPGVALFESSDLVNWSQTGYVLTRKEQVELESVNSSGGVFAPTIRCHGDRFYMVTNNNTTNRNFYVYTDDIYSEWSDPVTVDQGGIDPSLLFDGDKVYFISNGVDDNGREGIIQCEIDIESGRKLTQSKCIWNGSGGRYLESPHMYHIGNYYYLMAAEGGTEYGHMITLARATSPWGPFENSPRQPILTNRDKAPCIIQGIGHGDLIQDKQGGWHIVCLGFRQIHPWMPYHNLGREVFLVPASITSDGWIAAGNNGVCDESFEMPGGFTQQSNKLYTFEEVDRRFLRIPNIDNYSFSEDTIRLTGCDKTLDDVASPTFVGMHQRDFVFEMRTAVTAFEGMGEAGITAFMCEDEHYEAAIVKDGSGFNAILRLNIGGIKHIENTIRIGDVSKIPTQLVLQGNNFLYSFAVRQGDTLTELGSGKTKYLSSEVSSGFTGTLLALYATGNVTAQFERPFVKYE